MSDIQTHFSTDKLGRPVGAVWTDKSGITHRAVGATIHPGIRLMWTVCEQSDIPANGAWMERAGEDCINCPACAQKP